MAPPTTIAGGSSGNLHACIDDSRSLGQHLASRLLQIGCDTVFGVPGDYNLILLDQLIKSAPRLKMRYCCNELNAGYAADGYARARGIGCVVVTYTVGGLSVLNAVAGAASERLPLIVVTGGPNSNDWGSNRVLHHTIGLPDFDQESRAFAPFVAKVTRIHALEDAHWQLDDAIATALRESMPVYINIACNIAGLPHATFEREPIPFSLAPKHSNAHSLQLAVDTAVELLATAVKPVLVGGVKLRPAECRDGFAALAAALKCPVAIMPNAKGMVDETMERFIGVYWGQVSTPYAAEIIESADVAIFAGPIFNDYTTVGYTLLLKREKTIIIEPDRVVIANRRYFQCIHMADFLAALAKRVTPNEAAWINHQRMYVPAGELVKPAPDAPLVTKVAFQHIQKLVNTTPSALVVETGDSWFNGLKLKLPAGTPYEFQCQYGSIGWSVGATLGAAAAYEGDDRRVVAIIGDGSLQMTVQDISTMLRYNLAPIIFLANNNGLTIEVEIHDGPKVNNYNDTQPWDYTRVVQGFKGASDAKLFTARATTETELQAAIAEAVAKPDHLAFIEFVIDRDDCSRELLEWGSRVAAANGRAPDPR